MRINVVDRRKLHTDWNFWLRVQNLVGDFLGKWKEKRPDKRGGKKTTF